MNKLLRMLLAVLLVAVLMLGIVACNEDETPAADDPAQTETPAGDNKNNTHTHTEEVIPGKAATCTETGLTEGKKCSTCGEILVAQTEIPKVDHTWNAGEETKAPEVGVAGEKTFTCTVCGETKTEEIPALDPPAHEHNYDDVEYSYDAEGHWKECACGEAQTEKVAHTFGEWEQTKAPEVGVAGEKTRSCTCGYAETEEIPALPEPPSGEPTWNEYNLNLNTTGIKLLGERNGTKASDGRIWLDWAGSGIEMNVHLDFTYTVRLFVQAMAEEGDCIFVVYVDGEFFNEYVVACGIEEQVIDLEDVPAGDHIIRIIKATDYTVTSAEILMVWMDGHFNETPADNELYIEFIGDAITTGNENVTKSYAWLVAESFNADYAITALNGHGLLTGTSELSNGSMAEFYEKVNPLRDPMAAYRFGREADVVVINLGADDYFMAEMYDDYQDEQFAEAYAAFIENVRYWNADAKILCVYGAVNDGYAEAIETAVEAVGGEAAGVWTLALELSAEESDGDYIAVPTEEEQAAYAEVIIEKINEIKDVVIEGEEPVVGEGESQDWNNA